MEKPNAETTAFFDRHIPDDVRAIRGQMFGHPCAFVFGNMFFGTFAQTVVVRVGEARAASLVASAGGAVNTFEPMPGRPWKEYVQVAPGAVVDNVLATWAREALEHTAALPPKEIRAKEKKAKAPARPKGSPRGER